MSFRTFSFSQKRNPAHFWGQHPFLPSPLSSRQLLISFPSPEICLSWTFPLRGITQYVRVVTGFFHAARGLCGSSTLGHLSVLRSFLLPNKIPLYGSIAFHYSIHRLTDLCFHFLTMMNNTIVNVRVDRCFHFPWVYAQEQNC